MAEPGRGWVLVTVDPGQEGPAFDMLVEVARAQEWNAAWHVKRIDPVRPMPDPYAPSEPVHLIAAVKAQDEATLIVAFGAITKALHDKGFSHVRGHRVGRDGDRTREYDFDWP